MALPSPRPSPFPSASPPAWIHPSEASPGTLEPHASDRRRPWSRARNRCKARGQVLLGRREHVGDIEREVRQLQGRGAVERKRVVQVLQEACRHDLGR